MRKLLIIGAGGHGKEVADTAQQTQQWDEIAFLDDCYSSVKQVGSWAIIGSVKQAGYWCKEYTDAVIAIGDNSVRLRLFFELQGLGFQLPAVLHPAAYISPFAVIEHGVVIFANAVVNIGAVIGKANIINTSASISHDCRLADGVHISPNASLAGGVCVGEESWIGIGASAIQAIKIGRRVVVGAGSVLLENVPDNVTVVGVPAKIIKHAN